MIIRIVKLEFKKEHLAEFLTYFDSIKLQVANQENCFGMKLLQEKGNPTVIMTYSHWKDQESLNKYRDSKLFGEVWPKIKPWFVNKAQAWTMEDYFSSFN